MGHKNFYCSKQCFVADKVATIIEKECLYCHKKFISSTRSDSKKCCSEYCAHKYAQTFTNNQNVSLAAKEAWKQREFVPKQKKCPICGTTFERKYTKCCSSDCAKMKMSEGGRKSSEVQKYHRSSKNECLFADLCETRYTKVLRNARMFNGWDADVILPEYKIAVLWNGNWHRKKITKVHSVQQVINRDKIKVDEIRKMGYNVYVIEDNGKFNPSFVNDEFAKFMLFISDRLYSTTEV